MIAPAASKSAGVEVSFKDAVAEALPFPDAHFDAVQCAKLTLRTNGLRRSRPAPYQEIRERVCVRSVAGDPPRQRIRGVDQNPQEVVTAAVGDAGGGARRRLVLGVDRRPPQGSRRAIVPAALHAAWAKEPVEPDQPRARRAVDEGRAHDTARTRTSGRGEGRWP